MPKGKSALSIVKKYYPQVTKVVDARRDAVVQVTADDCRRSKSKAPNACAMATAFEKQHDGAIISMSVAYLVTGRVATRYKVPGAVAREIVSFDRHHDFAPGEYKLNAPSEALTLGADKRRDRGEREHRNLGKYKPRHRTSGIRSL